MLITFGMITPMTAGIVLVLALVVFGPGKLPELGKALGKGIREFKNSTEGDLKTDDDKAVDKSEKKEL